ncbi:fatty acid desaturase 4, chloroplastic-like [Prosopis cineraria]|uniref:fatty acid desaturase 4, chloroplastic-like n=1 Tax=Prosopis cineraria TaxID=364024 RepID=UPI00240FCB7F|nr:fatty acid desaturase 4, chloroplastic-like [Prosopis cineraria]
MTLQWFHSFILYFESTQPEWEEEDRFFQLKRRNETLLYGFLTFSLVLDQTLFRGWFYHEVQFLVAASGAIFGLFTISVLVKISCGWRKILEVLLILGQFVIEKVMEAAQASTTLSATQLVMEQPHQLVSPKPVVVSSTANHPLANDPSLQSTRSHRAWVAAGCTTVIVSLAKCISQATIMEVWFEPILAGWVGYMLADLGSGVYHWAIDNYGDESTPVFGPQIDAFKRHHKWPLTITRHQFANILHVSACGVTLTVLPIVLVCNDLKLLGFVGVCSACIMFSLQIHAWAHRTKSRLPRLVVALQDAGVLVSQSKHAGHHRPPYNSNYCILSGAWNEFLDKHKVFEVLEKIVYSKLGVRPRFWSEPSSEWMEEIEKSWLNYLF